MLMPERRPADRGAVSIAVIAVMLMTSFAVAIVVRDVSAVRASRHHQDRVGALVATDVGVAHARASVGRSPGGPVGDSGSAGASTWAYTARPTAGARWEVTVDGETNSVSRRIVVDLEIAADARAARVVAYRVVAAT
jgi:hypothetical protein